MCSERRQGMSTEQDMRAQIARVGRLLAEKNLVCASEGNISARLEDGTILITETGSRLGEIDADRLAVSDMGGKSLNGRRPSSELNMHLRIYQARPDVRVVIHGHPRIATAWAMARRELPWKSHPEMIAVFGRIPVAPYGRPSSMELAEEVARTLKHANGCLMANHGAVVVGKDMDEARNRIEILESFATSAYIAFGLGGPKDLSSKELAVLTGRPALDFEE